jgi:hypothetical protein
MPADTLDDRPPVEPCGGRAQRFPIRAARGEQQETEFRYELVGRDFTVVAHDILPVENHCRDVPISFSAALIGGWTMLCPPLPVRARLRQASLSARPCWGGLVSLVKLRGGGATSVDINGIPDRVAIARHIVWRDVEGDLVLFDAHAERYHALNSVGSFIWRRISRDLPVSAILREAADFYTADADMIAADISAFLNGAIDLALLVPGDEAGRE